MRTEQDLLKDFEKLGYNKRTEKTYINLYNLDNDTCLFIDLEMRVYSKSNYLTSVDLTMQEHKLLNELFQIWGWI